MKDKAAQLQPGQRRIDRGQFFNRSLMAEQKLERALNEARNGLLEEGVGEASVTRVAPIDHRLRAAPIEPDGNPTGKPFRAGVQIHLSIHARRAACHAASISPAVISQPRSRPSFRTSGVSSERLFAACSCVCRAGSCKTSSRK